MKKIIVINTIFLAFVVSVFAGELISKIEIVGNDIVSDSTIISKIKTRSNQPYNENLINEDIKDLYATGYFENIEIEKRDAADGVVVIYRVKEKPVVKAIAVEGAKRIHKRRIEKLIEAEEGSFLDEYKLKETQNTIERFYRKRGFSEAIIDYSIEVDDENKAKVTFSIDEKTLARIRKIMIKGNICYRSKKITKLMRTKTKGFFRKGILKKEVLEDDIKRIDDFYKERGFSDVKVSYSLDYVKSNVHIVITIDEGNRQYISRIKVEGNREISLEDIEEKIEIKVGEVYVEKKVNENVNNVRGVYVDRGYIYAQVKPVLYFNPQTKKVDITFSIVENQVAYVERIDIKGNVKTKDKVIRRELRLYPGEKFEGSKIRKSRQRLDNLGFFEEVRFDSEPGSKPNWESLIVDVKEAKTGYLSFGGGYSSIDEFTGFIELRQRNFDYKNWSSFTGAGQDLSLLASIGNMTSRYELDFMNPWIFDQPISFGFQAYKKGHDRDEDVGYGYEENIKGGAIRFGKEFNDNYKGWIGYRLETVEISDLASDAGADLIAEKGTNDLSSLELDLSYDTRDNVFSPSEGIIFGNSLEVCGTFLAGDKDFIKYSSRLNAFFPSINKSVLELKLHLGVAEAFSGTDNVPIYKRFFAGGASTIRGYRERKIGPIDSSTGDPVGGEALFVTNIEYTYPLVDVLKMAVFFDSGNVWAKRSDFLSGGFKSSVGIGIRVKTPLGPIKLDYGFPFNKEPGEEGKEGRFHFSVSRGF